MFRCLKDFAEKNKEVKSIFFNKSCAEPRDFLSKISNDRLFKHEINCTKLKETRCILFTSTPPGAVPSRLLIAQRGVL